jgi:hypothetical protein
VSDIVTRLRNWRTVHLARLHLLMEEAADEMERLSANGDCPAPDNAARRDILTDKERWAIEASIAYLQPVENYDNRVQTVLRKLLERLSP